MNKRKQFSIVFYWLAIAFSFLNVVYVVALHWDFILEWKGVGVYSVISFMAIAVVTTIIWLVAFILEKNNKLTIIYWLTILIPSILFTFLPIKFYVE